MNIGSKVPALQKIAFDIHGCCLIRAISIDQQWIPRDLNFLAFDISKLVDRDDYTINDSVFLVLDELWGPHTCHRFAFHYNTKFRIFITRHYRPGSSGVNAFAQD